MVYFPLINREEEGMRPRKPFAEGSVEQLGTLLQQAKSVAEFKRIQCVWLRAALNMPVDQISRATGLATTSVRCFHSRYMSRGEAALLGPGRGGWRYQNIPLEKEKRLLGDFLAQAEQGGMLNVSLIKVSYEKLVGHKVPKSTVYRMLTRHGWRKLAPRPHHPKSDSARQQEFKKNCRNLS